MIEKTLEKELNIKSWQVNKVIKLIDEGNTIPFIARYRKDMTGGLDDEVLRKFDTRLRYLRNLEHKKEQVIEKINGLGKLTKELKEKILSAETLVELDDLYLPYKSKKRTKATIAREKCLEGLANIILKQDLTEPVENIAKKYLNPELDVNTAQEAIDGSKDIISELISENADFRKKIRENTLYHGFIETKVKKDSENYTMDLLKQKLKKIVKIQNMKYIITIQKNYQKSLHIGY